MREIIDIKQNGLKVYVRNHAKATFLSDGTTVESAIDLFNEKIDSQNSEISDKQNILVSGENIKTINGQSILGSGDIVIKNEEGLVVHCIINKSTDTVQIQNTTSNVGISWVAYTEDEPYAVPSYILLEMIVVCDLDYTYFMKEDGTILHKWPVYSRNKWSVLYCSFNGYEYVDLGLPSGTLWARCNVGANSETDTGLYFAWGETTAKSSYTSDNSVTHGLSTSELESRGIIDADGNLNAAYDAATVNWGEGWRMPTSDEMEELVNSCTWKRTVKGGVEGYKVTGPNGSSIFLPATGYRYGTSLNDAGSGGYYQSATPSSNKDSAHDIFYHLDNYYWGVFDRKYGRAVRPVINLNNLYYAK